MYPEIEPYDNGMLDVGDGHRLYWECCGDPNGKPAVVLHGGPGSGCNVGLRRYFDPRKYRVVLFDQRGCGRSTPLASEPDADLSANTTPHLIADIEKRDVGRLFPDAWARFREGVPPAERDGDLVAAYHRLLFDADPEVREKAARDWCDWETAHVSLRSSGRSARWDDPVFRLGFARLVTHYWDNAAFLEDGALLRDAPTLAGIPGVLIHGRFDVSSPLDIAWQIANAWPGCELVVVDDAGHSAGLGDAMLAALDRFAGGL